jgi:hypothetical protein
MKKKNKQIDGFYQLIIDECVEAKCFHLLEDKKGYSLLLRNFNYVKETKLDTMFTVRTDAKNMTVAEAFAIVKTPEALIELKNCLKHIYLYTVLVPTNIEERMIPLFVSDVLNKKIKCAYD